MSIQFIAVALLGVVLACSGSFVSGWHYMSKVCAGREAAATLAWNEKLAVEQKRRETALKQAQTKSADDIKLLQSINMDLELQLGELNNASKAHDNDTCLSVDSVMRLNKLGNPGRARTR